MGVKRLALILGIGLISLLVSVAQVATDRDEFVRRDAEAAANLRALDARIAKLENVQISERLALIEQSQRVTERLQWSIVLCVGGLVVKSLWEILLTRKRPMVCKFDREIECGDSE